MLTVAWSFLSVWGGGGYHLLGDIHMVSDSDVGELLNRVNPLFALCALF
jgi:hypothetical protein